MKYVLSILLVVTILSCKSEEALLKKANRMANSEVDINAFNTNKTAFYTIITTNEGKKYLEIYQIKDATKIYSKNFDLGVTAKWENNTILKIYPGSGRPQSEETSYLFDIVAKKIVPNTNNNKK